jgi:hypothetical protein
MNMKKLFYVWSIFVCLLSPASVWSDDERPWNSDRSPELGKLLRELNQLYGPDTVSLLSWLNDASIHHRRSVLTATVRVDGKEMRENLSFLTFTVETGVIFNTQTTDQPQRLADLWQTVLAKALSHFETFAVPTDGIMIDLLSHCKEFPEQDDLANHVDDPGPVEEIKFYFPGEMLRGYLGKKLSAQELLNKTHILINGAPTTWRLPEHAADKHDATVNKAYSQKYS